jgi:hypothetical protein
VLEGLPKQGFAVSGWQILAGVGWHGGVLRHADQLLGGIHGETVIAVGPQQREVLSIHGFLLPPGITPLITFTLFGAGRCGSIRIPGQSRAA